MLHSVIDRLVSVLRACKLCHVNQRYTQSDFYYAVSETPSTGNLRTALRSIRALHVLWKKERKEKNSIDRIAQCNGQTLTVSECSWHVSIYCSDCRVPTLSSPYNDPPSNQINVVVWLTEHSDCHEIFMFVLWPSVVSLFHRAAIPFLF